MHLSLPPNGRSRLVAALLVSLVGCAGGPLSTRIEATSPVAAPDVFACARDQLKAVGFSQSSYDADELRVTARKIDEKQRRPDVQFRRIVDRLEIDVGPGSGGALTNITVDAKTFAELTTQRGPTESQERTSETARGAAQTILQKCSQPVDSLSVPG
jgi:hypothetical protein